LISKKITLQKQVIDVLIRSTTLPTQIYCRFWTKPCHKRLFVVGMWFWRRTQAKRLVFKGTVLCQIMYEDSW